MKIKKNVKKVIDSAIIKKGQRGAKENYILHTYHENDVFYSFLHADKEAPTVGEKSDLVGHFSFGNKTDYLNYKKNIGSIFRNLSENGKEFERKEFANFLKKSVEELKINGWINPAWTPTTQATNKMARTTGFKSSGSYAPDSRKEKVMQIKPVILLETLRDLGLIDVQNVSPNTTGEEFWKYSIVNSHASYDFKTSLKNKNFVIGNAGSPKSDIFNDVFNSSKGYGMGSIGLMSYLGAHGFFEDPLVGKEKGQERYSRSLNFLHDKVLPHVPKELLVENIKNQEEIIELDNYSRLPFKKKGQEELIKNFLLFRGLEEKTIDNLISKEKVYGGFFSQNSFERGHKLHFNQVFFDLENSEDKVVGAERFMIKDLGDNGFKTSKFNTAKVAGNAFKIRGKTPKVTILTEAIIDALSEYELIKESQLPVSNYNIFSVQGCGHLNNWFQHNLGFGFQLNENFQDQYGKVFAVTKKENHVALSPAKKEKYKKALEGHDLYYVSILEEDDVKNLEKLKVLEEVLDKKCTIIEKKYRAEYIDYNQYTNKNSVFLDSTNFDNFFNVNNLDFSYDTYDKEFSLKGYSVSNQPEKLTPQKVEEIKDTMQKKLGCQDIALAFDNDDAGLKYAVLKDYLQEALGIKVYNSIPDSVKKDTDLNDILKVYNENKEKNPEKAKEIIENHIRKVEPDFQFKKKITNNENQQVKPKKQLRP